MSQAASNPMTVDAFVEWQLLQPFRCELLHGRPMAMTGATFGHDIVVGNLAFALNAALRQIRSACRVFSADIGLVTGPNTLRRSDLSVYCPPFDTLASRSDKPILVVEVLSQSTDHVDQYAKLDEYRALASLRTILILDPGRVDVGVWRRHSDASWKLTRHKDDDRATVEIAGLGITLALRDVYDGADLRPLPWPRLIWPD